MAKKLATARLNLIRFGDANSATNQRHRAYAFEMVSAIVQAFSPALEKDACITLERGYSVQAYTTKDYPHLHIFNNKIESGCPFYSIRKDEQYPPKEMLSYKATIVVAEDIANGWILDVLRTISRRCDMPTALKLGGELSILPEQWRSRR